MFLDFITRNGKTAILDGVSNIRFTDQKEIMQYTGKVDGTNYTWDNFGRLAVNQLLNYGSKHELDLVDCYEETYTNPGLYYFEFKKEVMNGRK
jgi:hypothetical protein